MTVKFDPHKYTVERRQKLVTDVIVAILLYYSQYVEKQISQSNAHTDQMLILAALGVFVAFEYITGYKIRVWFRTSKYQYMQRIAEVLTVFTDTVLFVFARLYTTIIVAWAREYASGISKDSIGYSLTLSYYGTIAISFLFLFIGSANTSDASYREVYYTMVINRVSFLFVYIMATVVADPTSPTYYDHLAELAVVASFLGVVTSLSCIETFRHRVAVAGEIIDTFLRIVVLVFARVCTNYITSTTEITGMQFHKFTIPLGMACTVAFITKVYADDRVTRRLSMYLDDISLSLVLYIAMSVLGLITKSRDGIVLYLTTISVMFIFIVLFIVQSRVLYTAVTISMSHDSFEFIVAIMDVFTRIAVYTFTRLVITIIDQSQYGGTGGFDIFLNIVLPSSVIIVAVLFMPSADVRIMQYTDTTASATTSVR